MATAKRAASRKTAKRSTAKRSAPKRSAAKRSTSKEPAALNRLNKSLDSAQEALAALSKEVGKDVSTGARDLQKNLNRFVKDARRDSGKLGTAIQRDIEKLQKRISSSTTGRKTSGRAAAKKRSTAKSGTAKRSTAKRSTAKRTTAKRSTARRPAARRSSARSGSRSRSR
jgi:hypothetical protein